MPKASTPPVIGVSGRCGLGPNTSRNVSSSTRPRPKVSSSVVTCRSPVWKTRWINAAFDDVADRQHDERNQDQQQPERQPDRCERQRR